jgi:hypothetical protein
MHTAYKHDLTGEILDAFRAQGIAPGIYFSPDDFWWLWKNNIEIQRGIPGVQPGNNPGLMKHDLARQWAFLEPAGQRFAFQVFHHQIVDSILLTDIMERTDVEMAEARNRPLASRSHLSRASGELDRCSGRTLTATVRSSRVSRAL